MIKYKNFYLLKREKNTLLVLIIRYGMKKDIETVQFILSSNLNNLPAKLLLHFENLYPLSF